MIQVKSAGYNAGNFAQVTIDGTPVEMEKNENGHFRGLHVIVVNPYTAKPEVSKVFDTYKSSKNLEIFIDSQITNGHILVVACQDECTAYLSRISRQWLADLGSKEIWNL